MHYLMFICEHEPQKTSIQKIRGDKRRDLQYQTAIYSNNLYIKAFLFSNFAFVCEIKILHLRVRAMTRLHSYQR